MANAEPNQAITPRLIFQFTFACLPAFDHFSCQQAELKLWSFCFCFCFLNAPCEAPSHFNPKRTQIFLGLWTADFQAGNNFSQCYLIAFVGCFSTYFLELFVLSVQGWPKLMSCSEIAAWELTATVYHHWMEKPVWCICLTLTDKWGLYISMFRILGDLVNHSFLHANQWQIFSLF